MTARTRSTSKFITWITDSNRRFRIAVGIIFALFAAALAVNNALLILRDREAAVRHALNERQRDVDLIARVMDEKLQRMVDLGVSFATRVRFRAFVATGDWESAIALVAEVPKDFPQIERVVLTDVSGTLKAEVPRLADTIGGNFAYRDWYRGVTRDWKPYVSEVYQRLARPRISVVAVAVPIFPENSTVPAGILVVQISVRELLDWLLAARHNGATIDYFVDQSGHVVAHPALTPSQDIVDLSNVLIVQKLMKGAYGADIVTSPDGQKKVTAYAPITDFHWGVVSEQPLEEALRLNDASLRTNVAIQLAFSLIILLLAALELQVARRADAAHAREKLFLSSIGDALVAIDAAWKITLWNPMAEKLTSVSEKEALGRPFRDMIKFVRERDRMDAVDFVADVMTSGKPKQLSNHTMLVRRDGKEVPISDTAAPIFDRKGNVEGVIIVFRDMTMEREVQRIHSEFAQASHQLRTPVVRASWTMEEALAENDPAKIKSLLVQAKRSVDGIKNVVESLVEVTEIDSNIVAPHWEETDVADAVALAAKKIGDKAHDRLIVVKAQVPKIKIVTDQTLLGRMLLEVLDNAVTYGATETAVQVKAKSSDDGLIIEVANEGLGIPEAQQGLIFTKFFRGENAPETTEGVGLGLYVASQYARLLGGKMWFTSDEKRTVFYILVPLQPKRRPA